MTIIEATRRFEAADKAWDDALPDVTNARYLPIGHGEVGSELRKLYVARELARIDFITAWTQRR